MEMNNDELILEEIKLLQTVIARQDEFQFRIKALAITVFSGLTIALFTFKAALSGADYVTITVVLSASFWMIGGIYGGDETRAVSRVAELEIILSDPKKVASYPGPSISGSLSFWKLPTSALLSVYARTLLHPRAWAPFVFLMGLSFFVSQYLAEPPGSAAKADQAPPSQGADAGG